MAKKKYIATPEKLWECFTEYKKSIKNNPLMVHGFFDKEGKSVKLKRERPLTMVGFQCYCYELGLIAYLGDYFANKNNCYPEYAIVCKRIKRNIRQDQIEGVMVGIYNASITANLTGLADKKEIRTKETFVGNVTLNIGFKS